jgi:hypothetical protein
MHRRQGSRGRTNGKPGLNDAAIVRLVQLSNPVSREYCRRRERNIILLVMASQIGAITWMLFRFALG